MSSKNKIKRVSKIFILLIVVMSLVLWLMPLGSIFAGGLAPPAGATRQNFDDPGQNENLISYDCNVSKLVIHAGLGTTTSGDITSSGNYGHIVEVNSDGSRPSGSVIYLAYYVSESHTLADPPYAYNSTDKIWTWTNPDNSSDIKYYKYFGNYVVTIGSNSASVAISSDDLGGGILHGLSYVDFYCDTVTGELTINKTTLNGLEGTFNFKIFDSGGNVVTEDAGGTTLPKPITITIGASGTGSWGPVTLPAGVYTVKEQAGAFINTIPGGSAPYTAPAVDLSNGGSGSADFTNDGTTEILYSIVVEKSTDGLVVANTDFNFNLVGPGTNVTKTIKAGAGSSGNITFENLKAGSYILTETNTGFNTWVSFSPDPKTSGSPGKSVTINLPEDAEDNIVYVYFHNDPSKEPPPKGKILVVKSVKDGLTGTFNFTVTDKNGTVVATTSITISKGEKIDSITISGLDPGTYTVTEAKGKGFVNKVPGKYVVDGVLVIKGDTATASFTNVPTKRKPPPEGEIEVLGIQELPFTGFNWIYYVVGMALIIAGGFTGISVIRLLKRKEQ